MNLRLFPIIFVSLILTGCASIDYNDYRQSVLVLSDPPGAQVRDHGELIGVTPGYMRVRRRKNPSIQIRDREVQLETHYRWGDSFGMNSLFISAAPFGWAIDYFTGTAWRIDDPPLQQFGKQKTWPTIRSAQVVAVAPPQGVDLEVANALGMAVDERLRAGEKFKVLNYEQTISLFQFYRSTSGLTEDKENRYRLLAELQADHILHTQAEVKGDKFVVTGELRDTVTNHVAKRYAWELTPGTEVLKEEFSADGFINKYFHILPNTAFFNFSAYTPNVTIDGLNYVGKEAPADGLGEEIAKYLSAISIARLEREQFNTRGHWMFGFVPTIVASQKRIVFPNYRPIDAEYQRWYVSAGYGIEGGYMGRYGFVYADVIPTLNWSQINYKTSEINGSVSRWSIRTMFELGYSYFFTDHLLARLYFRQLEEDRTVWDQALTRTRERPTATDSVNSGFVGLSIGYYLPTTAKRQKGWLVRKTSR